MFVSNRYYSTWNNDGENSYLLDVKAVHRVGFHFFIVRKIQEPGLIYETNLA